MFRHKSQTLLLVILLTFGFSLLRPQPALAEAANDDFANAIPVSDGYTGAVDMSTATLSEVESNYCVSSGMDAANARGVWYTFTGSRYLTYIEFYARTEEGVPTMLYSFTGTPDALVIHSGSGSPSGGVGVIFGAENNELYYFLVCGIANQYSVEFTVLNPPNDDMADATRIPSVPFSVQHDLRYSTFEGTDEKALVPESLGIHGTVWYEFTPAVTGIYRASDTDITTMVHVFLLEGNTMTPVGVRGEGMDNFTHFAGEAGKNYYIQVGTTDILLPPPGTFALEALPDIQANFTWDPSAPTRLDTITFILSIAGEYWFEPQSFAWDFGDGVTSVSTHPTHQYAADGDYTVSLKATMTDGRTDSISKVVSVRTHDVSITRFGLPENARVWQTRPIYVYITNSAYTEKVRVELYSSSPTGWILFGSLTQTLPPAPVNQPYRYAFSYTFTKADLAVGKVNFRAVATIVDKDGQVIPDAIPSDNEALSLPVRVRR